MPDGDAPAERERPRLFSEATEPAPKEERKIQVNIDWNQVELDDIELPEGEDFGIRSDDEEDDEELAEAETGFGSVIVVDNLPQIPQEKTDKLLGLLRKIFAPIGTIRENGLCMPMDEETQKSRGFAFIEFTSPQEAQAAREKTHGYKLDKHHVFEVNMFDDFDKYEKLADEWVAPEQKEYVPQENLCAWTMERLGRDQFVIRYGTETEIYWNDSRQAKPDPVYQKPFWTESFVQWSPLGTYLATMHRQGVAIWGGESWSRIMRYAHQQVRLLDFSPGERFLTTYSSHEPATPRDSAKVVLNVYDVRTGRVQRDFSGSADDFASNPGGGSGGGVQWPVFRWAGGREDKFFARLGKGSISVYETETMGLLDKKSIKVDGVADFSWSPTEPLICFYVPEQHGGNQPARVCLMQIPSREELRQKNLFSVSDCKTFWQSAGDYLAVKVERYTKTKKTTYSGFELFRIRERDIPIEVLEMENKNDKVITFSWEPKGHRFAVVHGDGPRPDVTFYSMRAALAASSDKGKAGGPGGAASSALANKVTLLSTLKAKQCNAVYWSPQGRFAVLAGLKQYNGQLEFYDVEEGVTMASGEHFMATDVEWDPTGRFVATSVTSVHQMENGFNIWAFNGRLLYRLPRDQFYQFLWRPRPPTLLSAEKEAEMAKNLRTYSKKYDEEDAQAMGVASAAEVERRRSVWEQWKAMQAKWRHLREEEREEMLASGEISDDEEQEFEAEEVDVEEIMDIQEDVLFGFENID